MELKIYNQNDILKATVSPSDSSTSNEELMAESVLNLSFTLFEYIPLDVNDYIDFLGNRYWLIENYRPIKKSTIEYQYDVKFYGIEAKLKKALVLKVVDGDESSEFSLNDTPLAHVRLFVDNMNRISGAKIWSVGQVINTPNVNIEYKGTFCFDGLRDLASKTESEWWLNGYTLNLIRCEHSSLLDLGYDMGLLNISKDSNETAPFFTRLYPLGSSRNIDSKVYGSTRLRLPGDKQYVEQNTELGIVEQWEENAFADIYPRRIGHVGTVRFETRTIDGEERQVYYFTDPELPFNPNDYELADLKKKVKFQSGELEGNDFEVNWNNNTKEFEIINQYPYENQQLPGGLLIPGNGDDYILYNIRMPEEYYGLAEQEFAEAVNNLLKKYSIDTAIYKAPTDYIYFEENNISLQLGRRVRLRSDEYFKEGYRDSRVISISRKINNPQEMEIGCSLATSVGRLSQIEYDLAKIQAAFKEQPQKGSNTSLQVLKSYDNIEPTEYNVFSAVRTMKMLSNVVVNLNEKFIRKDVPDEAHSLITFESGLCTPGFKDGFTSEASGLKMYADGSLTLMKLSTRKEALFGKSLSSPDFTSGFPNGTGWALAPYEQLNAAGVKEIKYKLEIDDLTIRRGFRAFEMIVSQYVGENDNRVFSGQMKVDHIDRENSIIYLKTEEGILYNTFRKDDILMVQRFGGMPTAENDYNVIKYYEFDVAEAGIGNLSDKKERLDYIRYTNFVGDISAVEEGDVLTRADNTTNLTRKGLMKIVTIDEFGAPYLDVVWGMKTDPENCTKVRLGNMEGLITPYWGRLEGWGLMATNAYLKGRFMLHTGEDGLTKFEITEGLIRSEISAVRTEISEKYNYLSNASFSENTDKWEAASNIRLFTVVFGRFLYMNDNFYSNKQKVAAVVVEGDRRALRLKKAGIKQLNANLAGKPVLELDKPEGEKVWPTFYLTFKYKCVKKGTLKIGFPGKDMFFEEKLEETDIFLTKEYSAIWDGTGDFTVEFSGDIYIYSLSLTDNPLENYKIETTTRFYQTDTKIGLWAEKTDKIGKTVTTLGIDLDALEERLLLYVNKTDQINNTVLNLGISLDATKEKLSLYANKTDDLNGTVRQLGIDLNVLDGQLSLYVKDSDLSGYELVSRINLSPSNIKISSKNISLVGAVTFSSLDYELWTAVNGKADSTSLGDMAYINKVKDAMTKESVLIGGYFNTSLIKADEIFARQATIGKFKIADGKLDWTGNGDNASLALGYNSWFGAACIAVRAGFYGNGISAISDNGGAAFFGSMYSTPSYPSTSNLYAAYLDGDLVMTRGNIIVRGGGVSGKGAIQADRMLPQNGWSGSFKGKSVKVENGIITEVW